MRLYKGEFLDILKALMMMKVSEGEYVEEFQNEFARYIGVKYAIATCTGRNGLELILEALKLKNGDEVILPAYTLKDLALLIKDRGFIPVLVDIDEDTYNIDIQLIEKAITQRTRVIIATHIFGSPCDIEKIIKITKEYNINVIEDCAHAAGAEYKGQKIGSFGRAAFFSFEAIKPINTFGGGMVTTNDPIISEYINNKIAGLPYNNRKVIFKIFYTYCEHFILHSPFYFFISLFFRSEFFLKVISSIYLSVHHASRISKFRYSNLQALIGLKQLKILDRNNLLRKQKADSLIKLLGDGITAQKILPYADTVYYFFLIKTESCSKELRRRLLKKWIDAGMGSEITDDCSQVLYRLSLPNVKKVYEHVLQIPFYDDLRDKDIRYITESINNLKRSTILNSL